MRCVSGIATEPIHWHPVFLDHSGIHDEATWSWACSGQSDIEHYRELLSWGSVSMKAIGNSLGLSLAASTVAVIIGTGFALAIGKSSSFMQRVIDLFSLLPNTVPGIVMVVGLILFWNSPWMPVTLYNTYGMVVLTYVVLFLPYTVQYVKSSFTQIDGTLFQAGEVFGGRPLYILRRILVPLILPGMLAGWMMTLRLRRENWSVRYLYFRHRCRRRRRIFLPSSNRVRYPLVWRWQ